MAFFTINVQTASNTAADKVWLNNALRKKATKKNATSKERSSTDHNNHHSHSHSHSHGGSLSSVRQLVRSFSDRYNFTSSPRLNSKVDRSSCSTRSHESTNLSTSSSFAAANSSSLNSSATIGPRSSSSFDAFVFTSNSPAVAKKPWPADEPQQEKKLDDGDDAGEFWSFYFRGTPSPSSSSSLWSSHSLLSLKSAKASQGTARSLPSSCAVDGHSSSASQLPHSIEKSAVSKDSDHAADLWQKLETLTIEEGKEESVKKAVMLLRDVCVRQDEEMRMLKAGLNATMREVAQLHATCKIQERELEQSRTAIPALQSQVSSLAQQLAIAAMAGEFVQQQHEEEAKNGERQQLQDVSTIHQLQLVNERETVSNTIINCSESSDSALIIKDALELGQLVQTQAQALSSAGEDDRLPPEEGKSSRFTTMNRCTQMRPPAASSSRSTHEEGRHRRGFSAVLSTEKLLKQNEKRASKRQATAEKESRSALGELNGVAEKKQEQEGMAVVVQQEGCENAQREWRSTSSRFASLEPLKSIFTCTSPQLLLREDENVKVESISNTVWNLKPN